MNGPYAKSEAGFGNWVISDARGETVCEIEAKWPETEQGNIAAKRRADLVLNSLNVAHAVLQLKETS